MQIIPFPAHYQSVYTNFDISSFSLISCNAIKHQCHAHWYLIERRMILNGKPCVMFFEHKNSKNGISALFTAQ